jgi:ABC transport system ATP-binding/permease protein
VFEMEHATLRIGERELLRDAELWLERGEHVSLIGPNGSGKTTILRLLLGELAPDAGTIKLGTNLEIAYFDQLREQLDPDKTVFESIADGADWIDVGEGRKHVHSYLQDFLFGPDRARTPVRALSGGERNRLLLARLFTRSFNLLVLDEPTNDLDIETLDLLENLLIEFSGTLLLVSHDRAFLDNVVTSTLVFEGGGRVGEYAGGYSDWARQRAKRVVARQPAKRAAPPSEPQRAPKKRRLSMKEATELAALPEKIDALDREREALYLELSDVALARDGTAIASRRSRLAAIELETAAAMRRWEELETISAET